MKFVGLKMDPVMYRALEALVDAERGPWNLDSASVGELLNKLAYVHLRHVCTAGGDRTKLAPATITSLAEATVFGDLGKRRRRSKTRPAVHIAAPV